MNRYHVGRAIELLSSVSVCVAALAVVFSVVSARFQNGRDGGAAGVLPAAPLSTEGAAVLGKPSARIALVEYSDFQCPYCARFVTEVLPELRSKYLDPGIARLVFRNYPLDRVHPKARAAAVAAACAAEQGQFEIVHDTLFAERQLPSTADIAALVANGPQFEVCVRQEGPHRVNLDISTGRELKIQSTPTFFIGTTTANGTIDVRHRLTGLQPLEEFEQIIDGLNRTVK